MSSPKPQSKVVYRIKRVMKDIALDLLFPRLYKHAVVACPSPQKVIFLETKESTMPQAMRHIWERLLAQTCYDVEFVTLRQNNSRIPRYYLHCRDAVPKLAQASHIFLCDASDLVSGLPIRPETKVIQLWHGAGAFKKWGMSTADDKFGESRKDQTRHPFYGNLDLVCTSSPEVVWAYEEAMNLGQGRAASGGAGQGSAAAYAEQGGAGSSAAEGKVPAEAGIVQPVGVAATDVFFDPAFLADARRSVEAAVPAARGKKVLLYAPTFRGRVRYAQGPDALDIPAFAQALGKDWVLLVRHHPYVKNPPDIPEECTGFAFDVSGQERLGIEVLLAAADALVTDYSSIIFDYSLLGRPLCFFAFDQENYTDWRGFYYSLEEYGCGPVFTESAQVLDWVQSLEGGFDAARLDAFRARFMASCDGHAVDRIFDFAFGGDLAAHARPRAEAVLKAADAGPVDISIVIPAHNAASGLQRALEHVQAQTYNHARMECIVLDDGSTDDTAAVAQDFAASDPNLFKVIHRADCSGTPAAPRNDGLAAARGTYVFFHDADDYLEPDAVERMLDNAVNWGSDVLLVKMFDDDNRGLPQSMFGFSQPSADKYRSKVMWSFAPIKLFRRSLVASLRFPDYMPEDIPFVLRAYVAADVVSVAADGWYYHATMGGQGPCASMGGAASHASVTTWDNVDSNIEAYRDIFDFVADNVPDKDRDPVLMRRLFWRDIYHCFVAIAQEAAADSAAASRHYEELVEIVKPFWREGVYKTCPADVRAVLQAALEGGLDSLSNVNNLD